MIKTSAFQREEQVFMRREKKIAHFGSVCSDQTGLSVVKDPYVAVMSCSIYVGTRVQETTECTPEWNIWYTRQP
ncbi:unnamed protein product [Caretta caretta]